MEPVPEDVGLVAPVLEFRDDLRQEVAAPAVGAAHPLDPLGLRAGFSVDAMRERRRLLHGPVHGTKEQLWKRLLVFGEVARKDAAVQCEVAAELDALSPRVVGTRTSRLSTSSTLTRRSREC